MISLTIMATRARTSSAFTVGRNIGLVTNHNLHKNHRIISTRFASVTGNVYQANNDDDDKVRVTLFTKEGCTLCDKVKDILKECRDEVPHSLDQVDITDESHAEWHSKYKYDIPVLHVNSQYWLKHRTTLEEAKAGLLEAAQKGLDFPARSGEPNAEAMERN